MQETNSSRHRSWLFTPGTRPDRFTKAMAAGADVLVIDLEDAVAPKHKSTARLNALAYLSEHPELACARALRINALDTAAGICDLHALLGSDASPDFIVLPKTESAAHLQILDRLLHDSNKLTRLVGLIESAKGLAALETIAAASSRLAALMFGAADMAADLGAETSWAPLAYARSRLVAGCSAAGLLAIDAPFFKLADALGLAAEIKQATTFGFNAKAAIHPGQVVAINNALTPTPAMLAAARRVLAENAKGAGTMDGYMVDEAIARKARQRLAAAGETSQLD